MRLRSFGFLWNWGLSVVWFRKSGKIWKKVQLSTEDEKFIDELAYSHRVGYVEAIFHKHFYRLIDHGILDYAFECKVCGYNKVMARVRFWHY